MRPWHLTSLHQPNSSKFIPRSNKPHNSIRNKQNIEVPGHLINGHFSALNRNEIRQATMYKRDPPDWKGKFPFLRRRTIFDFLELPSELRAEIYRLVLGGGTIHIDYPGCKDAKNFIDGRAFICSASISDAESFAQLGWQPKRSPSKLYFAIRHSKCTGSVAAALPLWVMGLCKQIYKEASLVPFQENCFTFSAPQSIESFIRRLTLFQQKALTHVAVIQTSTWTMWEAPRVSNPLKLPPYLNIKRLTIVIELCPANLHLKNERAVTSVEVQDRLVSRMSVLWSPKLEKVEVLINNTDIPQHGDYRGLTVQDIEAWTKRIKKTLLPVADLAEAEGLDEELDALCGD
jgi:hypothetical protein